MLITKLIMKKDKLFCEIKICSFRKALNPVWYRDVFQDNTFKAKAKASARSIL